MYPTWEQDQPEDPFRIDMTMGKLYLLLDYSTMYASFDATVKCEGEPEDQWWVGGDRVLPTVEDLQRAVDACDYYDQPIIDWSMHPLLPQALRELRDFRERELEEDGTLR